MTSTVSNIKVRPTFTAEGCVAAARAMRPTLEAREASTIENRKVPKETIADFHKAGFFRMVQPARWGGIDTNWDAVTQVIAELAQGCASSAWVYSVVVLHHLFLSVWPEDIQEAVWGADNEVLMSSGLAPRPVERVEGGYRVTGDWSFSSGCDHAEYAMVGGAPAGAPPIMMLIPMRDLEIVDDWFTLGLRGTGSKTLRFDGTFVPDRWVVKLSDLWAAVRPANPRDPNNFWDRAPNLLFSGYCFSSVILGLSQKAVRIASDALRVRVSRGLNLRDSPTHQMRMGEALSTVESASFWLHQTAHMQSERVRRGEQVTSREIFESAAQIAVIVRRLRDTAFVLADTSSQWVYDRDPLQQVIRDIMTGSTHRSASLDAMLTPAGKTLIEQGGY